MHIKLIFKILIVHDSFLIYCTVIEELFHLLIKLSFVTFTFGVLLNFLCKHFQCFNLPFQWTERAISEHEQSRRFLEIRLATSVDILRCRQKLLWRIRPRIAAGLTSLRIEPEWPDRWLDCRSECEPRTRPEACLRFGIRKEPHYRTKIHFES